MQKILVLGAGLSSSSLINYLIENSEKYNWIVRVGDLDLELAKRKINNHQNAEAFQFDIFNENQRYEEIKNANIVVSMLPARFHFLVAQECVNHSINMVTASYISPEIKKMNDDAISKNIIILNEIGVDPGIDHMSAMQTIHKIQDNGGTITEFESYTGGLIAPENDNNPWNYKFTWNPRNVILAGQGVSKILRNGAIKYIPYNGLFRRTDTVSVPKFGEFEVYANRDSLYYRDVYGLQNLKTIIRGTMRRPGFCESWNIFVQLGLTDDTYIVENSETLTYNNFISSFLADETKIPAEHKIANIFGLRVDSDIMKKLIWTGIFENKKIGLKNVSPAQILQKLLENKWKLDKSDIDMIVMQHKFIFEKNNKKHQINSSMVIKGIDSVHTAMAITVGIPVAIATKLILTGEIKEKGVQIPISKSIYEPILKELENYEVKFIDEIKKL
jgi:saccharopine dehydrogenase-like NADP-dependent oxidoreductase